MKAITAFIGAGVSYALGCPTMDKITENVRHVPTVFNGYSIPIYSNVANILDSYYKNKKCNFEEIFFILELLETYLHAGHPNVKEEFKAPFTPFIDLENILKQIFPDSLPITCTPTVLLSQAKSNLIKYVAQIISNNVQPHQNWFIDFWKKALGSNRFDIATLNYDLAIESVINDYEDGFEDTGYGFYKFNPMLLIGLKTTILHLHGCVNYGYGKFPDKVLQYLNYNKEDLYKYDKFENAVNSWEPRIEYTSQSGEQAIIGPIITGLRKADKLIPYPYSFYNYWLTKSIFENKNLLIIGYSFSDLHFNSTIERIISLHKDCKVVVIDFRDFNGVSEYDEKCDKIIFSSVEIFRFFSKILKTLYPDTVFKNSNVVNCEAVISEDDNTRIYLGGYKNTVEKYGDEIINFLSS